MRLAGRFALTFRVRPAPKADGLRANSFVQRSDARRTAGKRSGDRGVKEAAASPHTDRAGYFDTGCSGRSGLGEFGFPAEAHDFVDTTRRWKRIGRIVPGRWGWDKRAGDESRAAPRDEDLAAAGIVGHRQQRKQSDSAAMLETIAPHATRSDGPHTAAPAGPPCASSQSSGVGVGAAARAQRDTGSLVCRQP